MALAFHLPGTYRGYLAYCYSENWATIKAYGIVGMVVICVKMDIFPLG